MLEIESSDDLNQSSTRILRVVCISKGRCDLTEQLVVVIGQVGAGQEIDVVECVQEFTAQFKIDLFGNLESLDSAQVESGEHRAGDE